MFEIILTRERMFGYNIIRTNVLREVAVMNGRLVLKNRKRFYTFIMLVTITLSCILLAVNVNGADTDSGYTTVTVEKGDTLWDLAKEYGRGGDIRQYIHKIEKTNHMTDCDIYEGDILIMPL